MGGSSAATKASVSQRAESASAQAADVEYVETMTIPVGELQKQGINAADIAKLTEQGITTIGMVLKQPVKQLLSIKGFSDAKVEKIRNAARKLDGSSPSYFITGTEVRERRKRCIKITTGCKAFDGILGGGMETGCITEAYGEFRTGKTQLAYQSGGGQGKVCFIDTEGNFRTERIEKIADRFGLDPDACLENIVVARIFTHDQQIDMLKPLAGLIAEHGPFRMIIVDSVIALFRVEFIGRGELSERQQKLGQYLAELVRIAEEFNVAVFLLNQCQADPGAMSMFGPVMKPVGGNVLAHASAWRLHLKKGREDQRIAKIIDSPTQPEAEVAFRLSDGGVIDV